ncbi:ATP-sensitive inward rectifier potassium channel 12-like [Gigantopelta aegis]|uniref:ATP-sensitive inward rectifier potassium channel 12-like n=1 Tax=Gigantopelta aegis TaxID=1735272 RepID=UPI001B88A21C|nr:ATP-sensitive inward rectifier potassium channel 12-like [Gigantopelta aegis]
MNKLEFLRRKRHDTLFNDDGLINIENTDIPDRFIKYLIDIFTTLIDIEWRWNLLIFFSGFVLTWLVFAVYFFLLCYLHGDLNETVKSDWTPCAENVQSFSAAVLFSIETMSTIGYGYRYVTESCPGAYIGVLVQSVIGAALQFALAGLVVAKIRRAKKRSITVIFSQYACVTKEDLNLRLVIRVGDIRKSDVIGAHARGFLIRKAFSKRGEPIPVQYFSVDFQSEGGGNILFLPWPTYIIHVINDQSPLYMFSKDDIEHENFELVVILEGVASTLGKTFQARKSYHPYEIKWGHRLSPLDVTTDSQERHIVDYEYFNDTFPVDTPECSAQELEGKGEGSSRSSSPKPSSNRRRSSCFEQLSIFRHRRSITDTGLGADFEDDDDENDDDDGVHSEPSVASEK